MDWNLYKNYLLNNIPGAKVVSGGREILCRCRECPDSVDPTHAHFYISIPYSNDKPSKYYCQKCNCRGYVTHKTLIAWGIYDRDLAMMITEYNSSINLKSNNRYNGDNFYYIKNKYTTIDDKSEEKRRYICKRVGRDLSFKDLRDLKIVVNLKDMLSTNNITQYTRENNILNDLDREFVGFLSVDNAFLNMRRTCIEGMVYKTIDKRYINYKIFDKFDTSQRFYVIPNQINVCTGNRIKVHISEGPFDILSVYLNLRNREPGIYSCVAGSNYMNTILYILLNLQLPYIELHFYVDNDKLGTIDRIKKISYMIPDPSIPIYMHNNTYPKEKDFGVPLNRIRENIIQIRNEYGNYFL